MSRSGYSEDYECDSREAQWALIRWRGAVNSAIRGKRGQAFLKEMLVTLDAMPEKRLIKEALRTSEGEVCAIGSVMVARGLDTEGVEVDDYEAIAAKLGINEKIVQEVEWENDTAWCMGTGITPEGRWREMRAWVVSKLKTEA